MAAIALEAVVHATVPGLIVPMFQVALWMWLAATALLSGQLGYARWLIYLCLGMSAGEAVGYLCVVPFQLVEVAGLANFHHVGTGCWAWFIKSGVLALAATATGRIEPDGARPRWLGRAIAFAVGAGLMLIFASFGRDHGVYLTDIERAKAQLGPKYAGYRVVPIGHEQVFFTGVRVLHRASLIAFDADHHDILDVNLEYEESWEGPGKR